jgi:hypothetical protein
MKKPNVGGRLEPGTIYGKNAARGQNSADETPN